MLLQGSEAAVSKLRLEMELPGPCAVFAEWAEPGSLIASDVEALRKAFTGAQEDDEVSIPTWRQWAHSVEVGQDIQAEVREVVVRIVGKQ